MSRSDEKRLDDIRGMCAKVASLVDLDQLWAIAEDDLPTVAEALGPSSR